MLGRAEGQPLALEFHLERGEYSNLGVLFFSSTHLVNRRHKRVQSVLALVFLLCFVTPKRNSYSTSMQ